MNILAIGAHPDDLEISCCGTLAQYVLQNNKVFMCHVTNGDLGHAVIMPDELIQIRKKESKEAGEITGATEVLSLDVPDSKIDSSDEVQIRKMIDLIRFVKPSLIITHNPEDYAKDHIEVSKLVFSASFASSVPHILTDNPSCDVIPPIYYMDTLAGINFQPMEYVDITNTIEKKLKALEAHQSQIKWMREHDGIDFLDFVKTVSKFRGLQCGVGYAEGFRKCEAWPRLNTKRLLP